jgi:hypothetical protein
MSYFDLFYHLVAITVLLKVFVRRSAAVAAAAGAGGLEPVPAQVTGG